MSRMIKISVVVTATLSLLCGTLFAQNGNGDDSDKFGEYGSFCSANDPTAGLSGRNYYQIAQKETVWKRADGLKGSTEDNIKVGVYFIDGTPEQRRQVERYAEEWIDRSAIPIEWVFGSQEKKHIRITFNGPSGWSLYGNQTLGSDGVEPTMSLHVYNENESVENRRSATLHEFGHALGLMHEQLNPLGHLHFHEDIIFPDLERLHWCHTDWTPATCKSEMRRQITQPTTPKHVCAGNPKYDPTSIMHYWFAKGWVDEYPKGLPANTDLSGGDLACVRQLYGSNDDQTSNDPEPDPYPRPTTHGCSPGGPCCSCCQGRSRDLNRRNLCRIPWPQMPPEWVRHFWDNDDW